MKLISTLALIVGTIAIPMQLIGMFTSDNKVLYLVLFLFTLPGYINAISDLITGERGKIKT